MSVAARWISRIARLHLVVSIKTLTLRLLSSFLKSSRMYSGNVRGTRIQLFNLITMFHVELLPISCYMCEASARVMALGSLIVSAAHMSTNNKISTTHNEHLLSANIMRVGRSMARVQTIQQHRSSPWSATIVVHFLDVVWMCWYHGDLKMERFCRAWSYWCVTVRLHSVNVLASRK